MGPHELIRVKDSMHHFAMLTIVNTTYTTWSGFGCRTHDQWHSACYTSSMVAACFPLLGRVEEDLLHLSPTIVHHGGY